MQNIETDSLSGQYSYNYLNNSEIYLKKTGRIFIILITALFIFLWSYSDEDILFFHKVLGTIIGTLTLAPLYLWITSKEKHIPFIELISLHYFFIFVPSLFLGPVKFIGATQASIIRDDDLTRLLLVIISGIFCLFVGYYAVRLPKIIKLPIFHFDQDRVIKICLIYLGIGAIGPILIPKLPSALFRVGELFFKINSCVAIYILNKYMYSGQLSLFQRNMYRAELGFFLIMCMATGWLGVVVLPILAYFLGMVQFTNYIPWKKIICVFLLIIVLQMSKSEFREQYWGEKIGGSPISSISDYFERSIYWIETAFSHLDSLGEGSKDLFMERANHLSFFGHVIIATPKYIPYLEGSSYKNIFIMLIPRLIMPDKPSIMLLMNDISIRYGWLSPQLEGRVALSAGLIDEGYMNFGITGVLFIMLVFGSLIRWLCDNLDDPEIGFGWQIALIGFVFGGGLNITALAVNYLGGLWQSMAFIAFLYLPCRIKDNVNVV